MAAVVPNQPIAPPLTFAEQEQRDVERLFTYHAPKGDQAERYADINGAALYLAKTILSNCRVPCEARHDAIKMVVLARMLANSAIACLE